MADIENLPAGGNSSAGVDAGETPPVTIKRGRGRPPGAANKPKAENGNPRPEREPPIDPALFGELGVKLAEIGDDLFALLIEAKAKQKLDETNFQRFLLEYRNLRLRQTEKESLKMAFTALGKKYSFLLQWGPEIMVLVVGVQYSARQANTLRMLGNLPDPKPSAQEPEKK